MAKACVVVALLALVPSTLAQGEAEAAGPAKARECRDFSPKCQQWALEGDCIRDRAYMDQFCRDSCHPECLVERRLLSPSQTTWGGALGTGGQAALPAPPRQAALPAPQAPLATQSGLGQTIGQPPLSGTQRAVGAQGPGPATPEWWGRRVAAAQGFQFLNQPQALPVPQPVPQRSAPGTAVRLTTEERLASDPAPSAKTVVSSALQQTRSQTNQVLLNPYNINNAQGSQAWRRRELGAGRAAGRRPCRDEHLACPRWAKAGECVKDAEFMLQVCPASCDRGCLSGSPSRSVQPRSSRVARTYGRPAPSSSFPTHAQHAVPPTTARAAPRPVQAHYCVNKHTVCDNWAGKGECELYPELMRQVCPASCIPECKAAAASASVPAAAQAPLATQAQPTAAQTPPVLAFLQPPPASQRLPAQPQAPPPQALPQALPQPAATQYYYYPQQTARAPQPQGQAALPAGPSGQPSAFGQGPGQAAPTRSGAAPPAIPPQYIIQHFAQQAQAQVPRQSQPQYNPQYDPSRYTQAAQYPPQAQRRSSYPPIGARASELSGQRSRGSPYPPRYAESQPREPYYPPPRSRGVGAPREGGRNQPAFLPQAGGPPLRASQLRGSGAPLRASQLPERSRYSRYPSPSSRSAPPEPLPSPTYSRAYPAPRDPDPRYAGGDDFPDSFGDDGGWGDGDYYEDGGFGAAGRGGGRRSASRSYDDAEPLFAEDRIALKSSDAKPPLNDPDDSTDFPH